jgi:hypothetical protein
LFVKEFFEISLFWAINFRSFFKDSENTFGRPIQLNKVVF